MIAMTSSEPDTLDVYRYHIDARKILVDAGVTLIVEDDQIDSIRSIGRESGVEYSIGFMTDSGEFVETSKMSFFDGSHQSENVDQLLDRLLPSKSDIDKLIDSSIRVDSTDQATRNMAAFARISLESTRSTLIPSEITIDSEARDIAKSLLDHDEIESVNEWHRLVQDRAHQVDEIERKIQDRHEEYSRQLNEWISDAVERARAEFKMNHPEPNAESDELLRQDLMRVVNELDAQIDSMIEKSRSELFDKLIESGVESLAPVARYLSLKNKLTEIVNSTPGSSSDRVVFDKPVEIEHVAVTNQDVSPATPVEVDYSEFTQLENDDVDADEDADEEDDSFAGSSILDDALAANEDDSHPREQNATLYEQMINDRPEVGRILTGEIPVVTNETETETEADGSEDEPDVDVDESADEGEDDIDIEEAEEPETEESEVEESAESSVEDELAIDEEVADEPETHVEDEFEADSPVSEFEFEDDESEDEESEDEESENDDIDDANVGLFDGVELDDSEEELVTEDPKVLTMASFNRLMKS